MADQAAIKQLIAAMLVPQQQRDMQLPEPWEAINPWRRPMVRGGIAARGLFGMDATPDQRVEDAFMALRGM